MRSQPDLLVPPSDRRRRLAPVNDDAAAPIPTDDLDWLQTVLGVVPGGRPHPYLARVVGDELRLLLPASRQGVLAALDRPADDRRLRQRTQAWAGRNAARLGLVGLLPGHRVELPPFGLLEHLADQLGHPELGAVVTLGPRRRNRKPVLQLLSADGTVVGYAKVGWSPLTTALVDNEAETLRRIEGRLDGPVVAPVIIHHGPWGAGSVAVASPLRLARGGRRPPPADGGSALAALVRTIAAAQPHQPTPVADMAVWAEWTAAGLGPEPAGPLDLDLDLGPVIERHREVELDLGLWHGDLTPWNLVTGPDGTMVWDWEFAGAGRPVGFDLLHHRFERHRRQPGGTSRRALQNLVGEASWVLAPLYPTGLPDRQREAVIDLYLCELLARECLLAHQRWDSALADLAPAALDLLRHRTGQ